MAKKGDKVKDSVRKKISKNMKGNLNAEKWDEKTVLSILENMVEVLESKYEVETSSTEEIKESDDVISFDEDGSPSKEGKGYRKSKVIKVSRTTHLKGELLIMFKIRNVNWFNQMAEKFKEVEAVSCLLEYIDMAMGVNTYNDAANGVTVAALAKMNLATHHKWSDRVDGKIEHDGKVDVERPEIPQHILDAYKNSAKYIDQSEDE